MCTLRITDMKPADFNSILKYIYTDQVDCENISVAFELLRASRKWGLAGLGIKSLTYLEEFVDNFEPKTDDAKDNLFDLLALSENTLTELSTKCYQIVMKHAQDLIPCTGYLNLDKAMVQKVLCHKDLKIEDQLKLFEAIRDWGLHYIQQQGLPFTALGTVVEEVIKVVDFEKINDSDFLGTVLTSECLGKAEVIAFFMTHGLEIPRNLDFNNNKQLPFWLTFCATSSRAKGSTTSKGTGRASKRSSVSSSSSLSSLAPVSEALTSIYAQHELRFRVDKNVKLLGVGFGFLFTTTDMGLNVHCQGPWETRQWTDIIQSYVRVSGEKQETADVRLMFLHPVRILANQSYKVMVKMVRMSHGSGEVELWGGCGGVACAETEDAEFSFINAAVDPDKAVEEGDADTNPSIITALLYRLDTDEPDPPPTIRRRRPAQPEEEVVSPPVSQANPWRQRSRPDTLRIPDTPYARKRSPASDVITVSEPPARKRERPPAEDYLPSSFSTNRWRTKPKEERPAADDYLPSSFSTNRWGRTRPKEDTATETKTERNKSTDDYLPSSFSTNRWTRPRPKEDGADTPKTHTERKTPEEITTDTARKTSTEENRWRTQPKEAAKDTPYGTRLRPNTKTEDVPSSHPFARRRESRDTATEVPFYLRKTEEAKPPAAPPGRSSRAPDTSSRHGGGEARASSPPAPSKSLRYGTSVNSSGSNLLALSSSSFGLEAGGRGTTTTGSKAVDRCGGSSTSTGRYGSTGTPGSTSSSRYGSTGTPGSTPGSTSSSRYGSTGTPGSTSSSRYGSTSTPGSTPGSTSSSRYGSTSMPIKYAPTGRGGSSLYSGTSGSGSAAASRYGVSGTPGRYTSTGDSPGTTGRYGASGAALGGRYGSGGKYGSSATTGASSGYGRVSGGSGQGSGCGLSRSSSSYSAAAPASSSGR
ncbi:hypothetical protein GWK47_035376 [Chionoecetes opilio]|uniref:BACK domain-containing protein n=1 Tax=Chionoecetes opilio TaxID=41210 RepID=A0A8J4YU16_CHIOP|nr:hypothetical protein GWK47_035376 [Chionoecetes opilio]